MADPDQLTALIENLARAKQVEAAAVLDVTDCRAHEEEWIARRIRAERDARYASERVANAKLALAIRCDALTDCDLEPELDPRLITGPEERDI